MLLYYPSFLVLDLSQPAPKEHLNYAFENASQFYQRLFIFLLTYQKIKRSPLLSLSLFLWCIANIFFGVFQNNDLLTVAKKWHFISHVHVWITQNTRFSFFFFVKTFQISFNWPFQTHHNAKFCKIKLYQRLLLRGCQFEEQQGLPQVPFSWPSPCHL